MANNDRAMMPANARPRPNNRPLGYEELSDDPELIALLQRCEQRSLSFSQDVVDGWLGMAGEFRKAKDALIGHGKASLWGRWVGRFKGLISLDTADALAEIGKANPADVQALRSDTFAKSGGISGIAAFLSAPKEVQAQVGVEGGITATRDAILDAARAHKQAEEAEARAQDAERRAAEAETKARRETDIKVQDAIAKTRRETEDAIALARREAVDARHEADLRKRDIEAAQQTLRAAQEEWQKRLKQATDEQRQQLERDHAKRIQALEEDQRRVRKLAAQAEERAKELANRLENARDAVTVRARWDTVAADLINKLDATINGLPTLTDAQYFEEHERTLVESVRRRAQTLADRMAELARKMTIVESR